MSPRKAILVLGVLFLLVACGEDESTDPTPSDTSPPATVVDFSGHATSRASVILGWTAPGDDGAAGQAARYEVRYSGTAITEASWPSATVAASPPTPHIAGRLEQFAVQGLELGTWHFAMKAVDDIGNTSALSNVVTIELIDTVAPDPIDDLAASARTISTITLSWTATGNDGAAGRATAYDLRYAQSAITEQTWAEAIPIAGLAAPGLPGAVESFVVSALQPSTLYYFAIKALDARPNASPLSNLVSESTTTPGLTQITFSPHSYGAFGPEWSPDGTRILFQADWAVPVTTQLYVVPAAGGEPTRWTPLDENVNGPEWSPDGSKIAFVRFRPEDDSFRDLVIMDAMPDATPTVLVPSTQLGIGTLAWSPDGTKIAYQVIVTTPPSSLIDLYVVPVAGGEPVRLRTGTHLGQLDWSPDGTRIAYASGTIEDLDLWVMPAAGGDGTQLTDDSSYDNAPAWSPDGQSIAFSSDRSGNIDLWVMSATGENPIQLTTDPGWDQDPCWSPDGTKLTFSNFKNQIGDIWVIDLE